MNTLTSEYTYMWCTCTAMLLVFSDNYHSFTKLKVPYGFRYVKHVLFFLCYQAVLKTSFLSLRIDHLFVPSTKGTDLKIKWTFILCNLWSECLTCAQAYCCVLGWVAEWLRGMEPAYVKRSRWEGNLCGNDWSGSVSQGYGMPRATGISPREFEESSPRGGQEKRGLVGWGLHR